MELIEVNGSLEIKIVKEILLIKEFKILVDRDKTLHKDIAKRELAAIGAFAAYNSFYDKHQSEAEKLNAVEKDYELKFDGEIFNAIKKYRELRFNIDIEYLSAAKNAAIKTISYLNGVDYDLRDKSNRPIYKISEVQKALREAPEVTKALMEAEERVRKGFEAKAIKGRADRTVSKNEIPSDMNRVREEDTLG
jgi:hypothetical protein